MEGMGTFELAGAGGDSNMRTAVHTRVIEDPLWGGKASGTAGKATFAMLSAGDEAPGQQIDGRGRRTRSSTSARSTSSAAAS